MSRLPTEYLRHILDEADFLIEQGAGLSEVAFLEDEAMKRAFVRSLEVIGEATKNLPDDFRVKHPEVPWRALAGMRDRLIHGYFGVDYEIVWEAAKEKVPALRLAILKIIEGTD